MFVNWYTPTQVLDMLKDDTSNGLYAIMLKNKNAFKPYNDEFHKEYKKHGQRDIIYIGKAFRNGGIKARLRNELRQSGKGTFFRSVGAVLKYNPKNNQKGRNITNYTFAECEKERIITFIESNFRVSYEVIKNKDEIESQEEKLICELEKKLICELEPIFNISSNPNNSLIVKAERTRCRGFARSTDVFS